MSSTRVVARCCHTLSVNHQHCCMRCGVQQAGGATVQVVKMKTEALRERTKWLQRSSPPAGEGEACGQDGITGNGGWVHAHHTQTKHHPQITTVLTSQSRSLSNHGPCMQQHRCRVFRLQVTVGFSANSVQVRQPTGPAVHSTD